MLNTHELARFLLAHPAQPINNREHEHNRDRWSEEFKHSSGWLQVGVLSNDPDEVVDKVIRRETP